MKYNVTTTTTDLISGATKNARTSFSNFDDAEDYVEAMRAEVMRSKDVLSVEYLADGEGYLIEYAPKMQVVIELSEVD